jgi:hypothetical protein
MKQMFIDWLTKLFSLFAWCTILVYCHTEPLSSFEIFVMSFLFVALYDISRWAKKKKDEYDDEKLWKR